MQTKVTSKIQSTLASLAIFLIIIGFCFGSIGILLLPFAFLQPQYALLVTITIILFYRIRFPFEFNGQFHFKRARKSPILKFIGAQHPWKTIYTTKLDATKRYMFGLSPHGIYPISWMFFTLDLASIDCQPIALMGDIVFRLPFTREFALIFGVANADWKSVKNAANNDRSVLIIGGAAREMIYSGKTPGVIHIVKRTGFIKAALMYGFTLVPVLGVGVDDMYRAHVFPWEWCKRLIGVYPFIALGKYEMIYPRDVEVFHVVGGPIPVERNENPTNEDIEKLSDMFYQGLEAALEFYNKKWNKEVKIEYIET